MDKLTITNVSKRYGEHVVLNQFSAELPLAGVTVLRGASGAGKTTIFRLLLGLEQPDAGEITGMQGKKPAVVFQEDRLLPWATALENVSLVSDAAIAEAALSRLGLNDSLLQLPSALSGGMRRRVALARALAYGGDLLFLDEPFTGLDEENRRIAASAILDAHVPVFIITHDDAEAELFGDYRELRLGENRIDI